MVFSKKVSAEKENFLKNENKNNVTKICLRTKSGTSQNGSCIIGKYCNSHKVKKGESNVSESIHPLFFNFGVNFLMSTVWQFISIHSYSFLDVILDLKNYDFIHIRITGTAVLKNVIRKTVFEIAIYENDYERLEQELLFLNHVCVDNILYAGQSPLHAASLSKNVKTLRILLLYGCKTNTVNSFGNTPLHIAVSENWLEGADVLLQFGASSDTMTADLINVKGIVKQTAFHSAIKEGNVAMVDIILKHNPNLTITDDNQNTILHMASSVQSLPLIKKFIDQKDIGSNFIHERNDQGDTPLHVLLRCEDNEKLNTLNLVTVQCTKQLVDKGAEVNATNDFEETPLYLACLHNLHLSVEVLLKAGSDPTVLTRKGHSMIHASCMSECPRSLTLILETNLVDHLILHEDLDSETPFHKAVNSFSIDSCELLLKRGERLGHKDKKGLTRCSLVLNQMPNAMELLTRIFDSYTRVSTKWIHSQNFNVIFDYSALLLNDDCAPEKSIISELISERFKDILKHPLLESFLYLKWRQIKPFFYLNVLLYTFFLLTQTTFLILTYGDNEIFPWYLSKNQSLLNVFRSLYLIHFILIIPPECVGLIVNFKSYMLLYETYIKLLNLGTAMFLVVTANKNLDSFVQRDVATVSVLSGWAVLMTNIGRFPTFGVYVLMFLKISKSIIKLLMSFSFLIIGFACAFQILFYNVETFKTLPLTLVKTLMMMIGEIDYGEIYDQGNLTIIYQEQSKHRMIYVYANDTLKLLVITSFLFLVPVLMANLLVGLAVNDIPDLQRQGNIRRLMKQATYIVACERLNKNLASYRFFPKSLLRIFTNHFSFCKEVVLYPNKAMQHSNKRYNIPLEVLKEATVIGAKIEEISTKENLCQSRIDLRTQFMQFYKQYNKNTQKHNESISLQANICESNYTSALATLQSLKHEIQDQSSLISQLSQQLSRIESSINKE